MWCGLEQVSFLGLSGRVCKMGVGSMLPQRLLWLKNFLDSSRVRQQLFLPRAYILQLSEKWEWEGCSRLEVEWGILRVPRPLSLPPSPQRASCPLPPAAVPVTGPGQSHPLLPSCKSRQDLKQAAGREPAWVSPGRVILSRLVRWGLGEFPLNRSSKLGGGGCDKRARKQQESSASP